MDPGGRVMYLHQHDTLTYKYEWIQIRERGTSFQGQTCLNRFESFSRNIDKV